MPRLSVLMPARNAEHTVVRAVRSTLSAMPRDSELAVLDDGSTDGTLERLASIEDPRLKIHQGRGAGVAAALQHLLSLTDSRLVARMDADDIVLPGRFAAQTRAIERGGQVVFASVVRVGDRLSAIRPTTPLRLETSALRLALLATNPFGHPTLMAEREAIERVGGYRPTLAEDYDLWLRLAAAGIRMLRMRRPVLAYRTYPGQTSGTLSWQDRAVHESMVLAAYDELSQQLLGVNRGAPGHRDRLRAAAAPVRGLQGIWLRRQVDSGPVLSLLGL